MKKIVYIAMALLVMISMSMSVCAINEQGSQYANTEVCATVDATYMVTIPVNQSIEFNTEETYMGDLKVSDVRIERTKGIVVTATSQNNWNMKNGQYLLPYTLKDDENDFTKATFTEAGSKPLYISITQDAWNQAASGAYKDIITFSVDYKTIS